MGVLKPSLLVLLAVIVTAVLLASPSHGLTNPIEIQNYRFFDSVTGESVNLKGAAYYPRPNVGELDKNNIDFFSDEYRHVWEPDIERFVELGLNAIRIYAVDPGLNHDAFMCALQEAGIYIVIGLAANCEGCAITKDDPPLCYPPELKDRGHLIIGAFAKYDNVLGFSAGNEIGLVSTGNNNAPCQKKFLRDMRAYLAGCPNARQIPIGVIIADIVRPEKIAYYNCGPDPFETTEWLGLNTYVACDETVTELENSPGLRDIRRDFENYSIPMMATEFGCLNSDFPPMDGYEAQRTFLQARWMHEPGMQATVVGSFVFEYSVERANTGGSAYPFSNFSLGNYGIGYYSPADCNHVDVNCTYTPKPEFYNLRDAYAATQTRGVVTRDAFQPDPNRLSISTCPPDFPPIETFQWEADSVQVFCPGGATFTCSGIGQPVSSPLTTSPTTIMMPTVAPTTPTPTLSTLPSFSITPSLTTTPPSQTTMVPISSPQPTNIPSSTEANRDPVGTNPMEIQDYKFFDSETGESVQIKGVVYYPRPNTGELNIENYDFYTEEFRHVWEPDIENFLDLGLNAIRIYAVDPGEDHDAFMCALQEAGIYVIVSLSANCEGCAIGDTAAPACYPPELKTRGHLVIGAFAKYDNVLGFSIGGEFGSVNYRANAPCRKKFIRDMRTYLANCPETRNVPIGLVIAGGERPGKFAYYNCGSGEYDTAEWVGVDMYVVCDPNVQELKNSTGMQTLINDVGNYSIPVVATAFGCLSEGFPDMDGFEAQRPFLQAQWMHEPEMDDKIAGSFAFEYSVEVENTNASYPFSQFADGNYGIGYYSPQFCDHNETNCTYIPKPEFDNLQQAYAATPTRGSLDRATFEPDPYRVFRSGCPPDVPSIEAFTWEADSVELFCPGVPSMQCPGLSNTDSGSIALCANSISCLPHIVLLFTTVAVLVFGV